jgi:hypothetical protein
MTPLRELSALLSECALYVGNNSGPKHIAAALGVPTIGIHSGVVDAVEWAPIGRRAVALRRNMVCSPCYLARMADCPRNFACMRGIEPTIVQEMSEVFLARPVERHVVSPLVETGAVVVAAPSLAAQQKARGRRKAVVAPKQAPKVGTPAVRAAKPAHKRRPKTSLARAR